MGQVPLTDSRLVLAISSVPDIFWFESMREGCRINWLPLVEVTQTHLWLGLAAEGSWAIGRKSGVVIVGIEEPIHPAWITVLEKPPDELAAQFAAKIEVLDIPASLEDFPMKEIVIEGLKSGNRRWIGSALMRINHDGLDEQYRDALRVASKSPAAGQQNRQAARRLLREFGE